MEKVMTPKFRVSFPNVFKPTAFQVGQDPKYSVVMLFDKSCDLKALKDLARRAAVDKWGENTSKWPKGMRNPFRDGDEEKPGVDGYENVTFVSASSKIKPGLVDSNVQPIIGEDEFYAGCYARATLTAYAYDIAGNRGVAFGLQNIQKLADGERFSGRSSAESEFEAVEDEFGGDTQTPPQTTEVKQESASDMFA